MRQIGAMNAIVGKLFVWMGEKAACIRVTGRANFAISIEFRKLLQHLQATAHPNVVLDLSGCEVMDSTFLGVLAFEAQRISGGKDSGPKLELLNANATVRGVIEDLDRKSVV